MKRADAMTYLTIAGFHEDRAAFTRLYIENKISYGSAKAAYEQGRAAKARGVRCTCIDCKPKEHTP